MEHLTEALDRLGVKTCPVCGKTGAKSLCVACRSVSYCGKACQKVAWPSHKRECRRIVRERAKILDKAAADYAADEAMAADACRPDIPPGAECYICGNDKYWKGDLVRGCSCRGPHAGFAHVRCLVANAEVKGEDGDDESFDGALKTCGQCRQEFMGPVRLALERAAWLRVAGRGGTSRSSADEYRQLVLRNVAGSLTDVKRFEEARVMLQENVATCRRVYGPNDAATIASEEVLAFTMYSDPGCDADNTREAIQLLTRVHEWKVVYYGPDDIRTIRAAAYLANALRKALRLVESESQWRDVLVWQRRVLGEAHADTLQTQNQLAIVLSLQHIKAGGSREKLDEARCICKASVPVARRVLGPNHSITMMFQRTYQKVQDVSRGPG